MGALPPRVIRAVALVAAVSAGVLLLPDASGVRAAASTSVSTAGTAVFDFGDAVAAGEPTSMTFNRPVVGMAGTRSGRGYWLVASDGGIFSFGDATFHGSTGATHLNQPIVAMAPTPTGHGYWLVASDGGIFTFGDAGYYGSGVGSLGPRQAAAGIVATPTGRGYRILAVPAVVHLGLAGDVHGAGRVAAFLAAGGDPLGGMRPDQAANEVNLVNLETAVGYSGQPENKQYTFLSPPLLLSRLKSAGVSVVNLANNHSEDFGVSGLLQTINYARAAGLQTIGAGMNSAQAYAPAVVSTPGGRVALIGLSQVVPSGWAATPDSPGVASAYDLSFAIAAVQAARREADYVVVMVHAGIELDQCPTALQLQLTSALVNAGAAVVVGSHPHVLQGLTRVGSAVVDYSLGNFVFYAGNPATGLLDVALQPGGSQYQFMPALMDGNGSPQPLYGSAADAVRSQVASLAPGAGRC